MTQQRSRHLAATAFPSPIDRVAPIPAAPVSPSVVMAGLIDHAIDALESGLHHVLRDVPHRGADETSSYDNSRGFLVQWAPEGRIRLGDMATALDAIDEDVRQLVASGAVARDATVTRDIRTTIARHAILATAVRCSLDLAKAVLAEQRGQPVNPEVTWERACRARDRWEATTRSRG